MEKGKRKKSSIELWASQLLKRTMYALEGDLLFTPLPQAPPHPTCHHTADMPRRTSGHVLLPKMHLLKLLRVQWRGEKNAPCPVSSILPSLFKSSSGMLLYLGTLIFSLDQQEEETNKQNEPLCPWQPALMLTPVQQIIHREAFPVKSSLSSHLFDPTIWEQELHNPFTWPNSPSQGLSMTKSTDFLQNWLYL